MSLQAPNLDSRTFDQLVKEARDRIPRFTPEWTNLNDSDPGMTLIKLQAWLTETLLYEVNRVPELNYIKFLQLLNISPTPAKAAKTDLYFMPKKLDRSTDPLSFFIPKNAQVQADDPDLTTPVIFETDRTLKAINGTIATVIASNSSGATQAKTLVTAYDSEKIETSINYSFYPFGEQPANNNVCLIGILLRPNRKPGEDYSQDVFPSGELDLAVNASQVFDLDDSGNKIDGPLGAQCLLPHEQLASSSSVDWSVYIGTNHSAEFIDEEENSSGWQTLFPASDGSAGLSRSGHLLLTIPEDISQVSLYQLPRSLWLEMGLKKLPSNGAELLSDLDDSELNFNVESIKEIDWETIVPASFLTDVEDICDDFSGLKSLLASIENQLTPTNLSREEWLKLDLGYSDPQIPEHSMAWLKVKVNTASYQPSLLSGFYVNTVPATAAVTRIEENLGQSDGRPAQSFTLAKTPVYFAPSTQSPDIELDVIEAGQAERWQRVDDFYQSDSQSRVYLLDPESGNVLFGDGVNGSIPVAGASIQVRRYRVGGGEEANVGEKTVTKLKTSLPLIDSVINLRPAIGGSSVESVENTRLRAPHDLKTRERAVTAEDFSFLARQTPEVAIHSAYALARRALDPLTQSLNEVDGAVTVVILPENSKQDLVQPSEAQLRAVCEYLNRKRLITTELYVTGPRYVNFEKIQAEIKVAQNADLKAVADLVQAELLRYFHPLKGGEDSKGWPFGEDVYFGNVYQLIQMIPGVNRVFGLQLKLQGITTSDCSDSIVLPEGHLIYLKAETINLKVSYDQR